MSVNDSTTSSDSTARSELLFLIAKFLSNGPCKQAADVLMRELEIHELIPKGYDWEGNQRNRSYDQLARLNSHVGPDHLLHMCQRLGPLLDQVVPTNTHGVRSLLGAGRMSLLRTPESISNPSWKLSHQMVLQNGCPRVKPKNLIKLSVVQSLHARQTAGAGMTVSSIPTCLYSKVTMIDRKLGHLSSVYCVTYDRTGDFIITGADDSLVKIWHARSGRLMATLRGHAAEITDMTVNQENTLLATGSMDKSVRVWSLRTKATVAVLHGHTGYITTIQFSPQCKGNVRILMSSGYDGSVCFWLWDVNTHQFNLKPKKFVERSHAGAQMLCSSFSPGGMFVATGNSDNVIRVYFLYASEPNKICELEAHTNKVDSICYSNSFNRFVSGSEDGTARIWHYERQEWRATILSMYTRLNSDGTEVMVEEPIRAEDKLRVTMVSWNLDDTLVVTAVSDFSVKVWNSSTGKLLHVLKEHDGDVFVLDAHPMDPRIILSAGHDGNIVLWDIAEGVKIKNFFNTIQGQGNGAVYDCKFTPDGQSFAATDNHGHLLFFGFGVNEKIKQVPHEVYFHTDYRPLIRDANNFVLDEQTQQPPHLMPPPFLVNIDGNPYPPALQRLVPGREQLNNSQLVPEIAVNEAGNSEVIGEQDDQVLAEMPVPEADVPAGQEAEVGEAAAPAAQQAAVVPHQQDHDYSRQRAEGEGAEPAPQQNGGRVQEGYDDDTEDEDGGRLGRLEERARPSIDEMIRQLQQEQDERILAAGGALPLASPPPPAADAVPEAREGRVGMRRAGEMEGVRQLGNMQQRAASSGLPAWSKSVLVQPLSHAILKTSEARRLALADDETIRYILERKKKQSVPNTPSTLFGNMSRGKQQLQARVEEKKKRSQLEQTARNRLTTRALYDTEEEEEEEETDESDRESNNSSYSDWTMEGSSNLQPPKRRSQRKPKHRQISSDDDDDDDEDEAIEIEYDDDDEEEEAVEDDHDEEYKAYLKRPKKVEKTEEVKEEGKKKGPPTAPKTKKPKKPSKKSKADSHRAGVSTPVELDQRYLPPEWLTGTIPRKTPYVPQMGDELMYFRQGHELYLQAVEKHKSYKLGSNISLPWHKNPQLREMELVKIVGLRYEVKPPRLCSLKLAYINWDTGKMLGGSFSIRYHDMPDVIDFLVLRQHFDIARRRNWKPGDRFRSMIDDQWWMGEIESQSPLNMMFPDSMFQCFFVHWDNGEYERLSPWDMEPINENLMPTSIGGGVPADPEELKDMLYTPKPCEWSSAGREAETERILRGLEAVMEHSVAEPFNAPVDLSAFPEYARSIEYTIDLSTIKARLENGYYRRINALQWDIRHIESNAKKFNEDGTPIFRSAGIVTDTLLRFISDPSCEDPMPILEELSGGQEFNWGNGDADDTEDEDEGASASSSTRRKRGSEGRGSRRQRGEPPPDPEEWKKRCADLLAFMQDCEDAAPFKDPVDLELYPNYLAVIETPMDLGTVGSKLSSGRYASPVEFAEDVRLIFHNSRSFNTNKRSRIYSMTLRLSAMFEEQVKTVLSSWSAVTRNKTSGSGSSSRRTSALSTAVLSGGQSANTGGQSVCNATNRGPSSQTHQPSGSRSGTSAALRSHTLGRSSEERARGAASTRRGVSRVVSDSDKTEVEEEEETEAVGRDSSDKENYNEDEDTEVEEEESEAPTVLSKNRQSAVSTHGRSQSTLNSHKCVSNGHTSYRTRAKTGSLRPKRYMSTDEEEERDTRKNSKRARSYSSRESSLQLADEEDNESTDNSSGESETHSDSDTKTRKHKSKAVKRKRRKTATRSRSRNSKKRRRREFSSGDEDNESEEETEESDSSESESEEELVHKPKPKSRSEVNIDKCAPGKKHTSSGKRTTRNQGKRTFNYLEDSYDEYEDDPSRLSVSSRGRLRKMTKRARANRTDD